MLHLLKDRRILVGMSGGISCYKTCDLVSWLTAAGAEVRVVMTENAKKFVSPITLQALCGNEVYHDFWNPVDKSGVDHIRMADFAEIFIITPATANILAKMAHGIADDLLSTTYVASDCIKLAVVAMNTRMYNHPATKDNLKTLERHGVNLMHPETGRLACGTVGVGRLPERDRIIEKIAQLLGAGRELEGKTVLVTAGPTHERIDPVRYLGNDSSGLQGFAIARAAKRMGADKVYLVSGPVSFDDPLDVETCRVESAGQMRDKCLELAPQADLIVMAAAVADFRPKEEKNKKIKRSGTTGMSLELEANPDILAELSQKRKKGALVCGFALETDSAIENAGEKLAKKNLDFIALNPAGVPGAGPGEPTNRLTVISGSGNNVELTQADKDEVAENLLKIIVRRFNE